LRIYFFFLVFFLFTHPCIPMCPGSCTTSNILFLLLLRNRIVEEGDGAMERFGAKQRVVWVEILGGQKKREPSFASFLVVALVIDNGSQSSFYE